MFSFSRRRNSKSSLRRKCIAAVASILLLSQNSAVAYISLGYLYGGSSPIYQNNISRTQNKVTMVMPDYFHIDANGNAVLTKTPDKAFIQTAQKAGIDVVAYVSNHWDRTAARKAMEKRSAVAATLGGWVLQYGLDGLDIDIENLTEADRDAFTDFVRLSSISLPKDRHLSVAVAANPYRHTTGWHGQYDYEALGKHCNTMLLMTYDQSYDGGEAGPVSSYSFTEDSIKEALLHVPKEKILMGIPFYGRYWASLNNGKAVKGKAFTVSDVDIITSHYSSSAWYDAKNHCARAAVTVKSTDPAIGLWGGKKLEAGKYDIWYENERSLATRMQLCDKYELAGVGIWALGQEPERIWKGYHLWLNGIPFTDLAGHWGEGAVSDLYRLGILSGVGGGLCAPNTKITRAEICVLLCKLLGIPQANTADAPDEIKNHWAAGWLWAAIKSDLMSGDGTSYRPGDLVTRAELASLCVNALHVPNTIDYSQDFFPDVNPSMWFNNAVITLRVYGIMNGSNYGMFNPYNSAGRAEAASVIRKMLDVERKTFASRSRSPSPKQSVLEPR